MVLLSAARRITTIRVRALVPVVLVVVTVQVRNIAYLIRNECLIYSRDRRLRLDQQHRLWCQSSGQQSFWFQYIRSVHECRRYVTQQKSDMERCAAESESLRFCDVVAVAAYTRFAALEDLYFEFFLKSFPTFDITCTTLLRFTTSHIRRNAAQTTNKTINRLR